MYIFSTPWQFSKQTKVNILEEPIPEEPSPTYFFFLFFFLTIHNNSNAKNYVQNHLFTFSVGTITIFSATAPLPFALGDEKSLCKPIG